MVLQGALELVDLVDHAINNRELQCTWKKHRTARLSGPSLGPSVSRSFSLQSSSPSSWIPLAVDWGEIPSPYPHRWRSTGGS